MKTCPACGSEIQKNTKRCPHCGADFSKQKQEPLKDYWAQKLNDQEEEDWTREVQGELPDINEKPVDLSYVKPPEQKKYVIIVGILLFLAGAAVLTGFFLRSRKKIIPVEGSGFYVGCTSSYDGLTVKNPHDWVELAPDGTMNLTLTGQMMEGRWRLQGTAFQGYMDHRDLTGTLENGILTFSYGGMDFCLSLPERKADVLRGEPRQPVTVPTEAMDYSWWQGDYYGAWILSEGTGSFADSGLHCHDVCGRIQVLENGEGQIQLWNEENKEGDRFCIAQVLFTEGSTDFGKMIVSWGKLYDMEMGSGAWSVDPGKSPFSHFEHLLYIRGNYQDPENPEDGFHYEILLRPWGESWEDIRSFYEESWMLPPGYDSWYLPLKNAGMKMPNYF